jgi:CHAD domain-containing protein
VARGESGYACRVVATTRETERKYEAPDEWQLPDPGALLGRGGDATVEDQELDAVYFDTPDLALARSGITLRRREGGSDAGWHLKLPAGPDSRDELRVPLGRARRRPPAALAALIRVYARGAPVSPVARLRTRRRRWLLTAADGRAVAELAEDRVTGSTLDGGPAEPGREVSWREIEVELTDHGSVELLDRIGTRLQEAGAHRSGSASKLSRVLADELAAPEAPPQRPGSAGAAVLDYLREQVGTLRAYDPLVRQDVPDSVHRMRVASRRLRSALQTYRRVLDRDATRPLVEELRWLGRELAAVRDTEVMAERFAEIVDGLPDEEVLGPVSATLDRAFGRDKAEARERALAALDGDRYLALHDGLDALLGDPPLTDRARRAGRRGLRADVRRAHRRLRRRMAAAERAPAGEAHDHALHETRKAAKRLRYAVEIAAPVVGRSATRMRKRLKPVQSLLGDHQDTVVARPVLRRLAAYAHQDGGNGYTFGLMNAAEAARADAAENRLPGRWKRLQKPKITGWLG